MKSSIDKVPESDQKELNEMKGNVKDLTGGALQNPLGEFVSCVVVFFLPKQYTKRHMLMGCRVN